MSDQIVRYTTTAAHNVVRYCPSCQKDRVVWAGVTEDDEMLTCCATCSRIIERAQFRALT